MNIFLIMRSSRKYPNPPQGGSLEIPRGRGVSKDKTFKRKYETKLEFLEGWVVENQNTLYGRDMDKFWNNTITTT